ncbi:cardiolipin synthase [Halobacillus sp. Marseille-Q1614]|uniref:cardiolipin synthase n=1 Tax=Halobacillus sp. Marseille-Q1614 TaxID=2709134 RepID=UPI00156F8879|nr:cardiolipin synthase [Halobacillus sp. Marseille-Q1614]
MILSFILIALIVIILLLFLDFKMGRKDHLARQRAFCFEKTPGDYLFYINGAPFFEALMQDIQDAKEYVDILFFIVSADETGYHFLDLLKKKAREGVRVRLLVDRIGSMKINKKIRRELQVAGVQFKFAEVPRFPYFFYKVNRRNHRKITIIDHKIAYIGSYNIGNVYLGGNADFYDWRDYHFRMVGPVVANLQKVFSDDWGETASNEEIPSCWENAKHEIKVTATDGNQLERHLLDIIGLAKKELLIGSPYFVPTKKVMDALKAAIDRGVHLHIMIPFKPDHPLVREAGLPFLYKLYRLGATVSLFDAGFYHAKIIVVDRAFADVGTANFDQRSMFLNKEVNVYFYDKPFIEELSAAFMIDAADSLTMDEKWIRKKAFTIRLKEQIAKPFLPLF